MADSNINRPKVWNPPQGGAGNIFYHSRPCGHRLTALQHLSLGLKPVRGNRDIVVLSPADSSEGRFSPQGKTNKQTTLKMDVRREANSQAVKEPNSKLQLGECQDDSVPLGADKWGLGFPALRFPALCWVQFSPPGQKPLPPGSP